MRAAIRRYFDEAGASGLRLDHNTNGREHLLVLGIRRQLDALRSNFKANLRRMAESFRDADPVIDEHLRSLEELEQESRVLGKEPTKNDPAFGEQAFRLLDALRTNGEIAEYIEALHGRYSAKKVAMKQREKKMEKQLAQFEGN